MPDRQPRRPTATAWNVPFRVAARLPERDAACATGGGRQAACAGCISSSSTRRRSAPSSHLHLSLDSGHWLSLFVCVSAQVMYGISAASGHIGDVVLWGLNPPAAGEVRVSAGGHRGGCLCGSWALIVNSRSTTRVTTFCPHISQHPLRSRCRRRWQFGRGREPTLRRRCDPWGAGALGLGEKDISRRASSRAKDEKGEPDASTDADALPARCSGPPAAAAGRNSRPELTASLPNSGAVRAQSAGATRRRLRPAGSSHEPALADGRAAAHVEDSAQALASPLPASC